MELLYQKKHRFWIILGFWLLIAVLLTTKSAFGQLHRTGFSTWFQNFFYQGSGALVWAAFTPLIIWFYKRFDFTVGKPHRAVLAHLLLSLVLAPLHRALALLLDFTARLFVDMEFFGSLNPLTVLKRFRFVILDSSINSLITYWLIVVVLIAFSYYRKYKSKEETLPTEEPSRQVLDQLKVKVEGVYRFIPAHSLISCESSGNYIILHTEEGQFRLRETMNKLEQKLGPEFIRVHRSSIVNIDYLESYEHLYQGEYLLRMSNGRQLTSTRGYRHNLQPILART